MNTSTHPLGTLIETDVARHRLRRVRLRRGSRRARAGVARPPHGQGQVGKLRLHRRRDRDGPRRPLPHKGGQWRRQKQTRDGTSIVAAIDRNAHGIPTSVIVHDPKSEIRAWTEPLARRAGWRSPPSGSTSPSSRRVQPPRPRHRGPRDRRRRRCRGRAPRAVGGHRARRLLLRPEVLHGRQPQPANRPLPARDNGRADP